jgi:hypothetical protein
MEVQSIANKDFRTVQEPFVQQTKAQEPKPLRRFPIAPFPGMIQNPIVKVDVNVEELHKALSSVCASCDLKSTATVCEFTCLAQAEDGNEQCRFVVSLFGVPNCPKTCIIQVDRHSGCPFFFRQVVTKTIGTPCSESKSAPRKPNLFRAPKLPESLSDDESKPDASSVESVIALATSNIFEQRTQGALVLADLCAESSAFALAFKEANGVEKISCLKNDSNSYVQRAVSRILVNV